MHSIFCFDGWTFILMHAKVCARVCVCVCVCVLGEYSTASLTHRTIKSLMEQIFIEFSLIHCFQGDSFFVPKFFVSKAPAEGSKLTKRKEGSK